MKASRIFQSGSNLHCEDRSIDRGDGGGDGSEDLITICQRTVLRRITPPSALTTYLPT